MTMMTMMTTVNQSTVISRDSRPVFSLTPTWRERERERKKENVLCPCHPPKRLFCAKNTHPVLQTHTHTHTHTHTTKRCIHHHHLRSFVLSFIVMVVVAERTFTPVDIVGVDENGKLIHELRNPENERQYAELLTKRHELLSLLPTLGNPGEHTTMMEQAEQIYNDMTTVAMSAPEAVGRRKMGLLSTVRPSLTLESWLAMEVVSRSLAVAVDEVRLAWEEYLTRIIEVFFREVYAPYGTVPSGSFLEEEADTGALGIAKEDEEEEEIAILPTGPLEPSPATQAKNTLVAQGGVDSLPRPDMAAFGANTLPSSMFTLPTPDTEEENGEDRQSSSGRLVKKITTTVYEYAPDNNNNNNNDDGDGRSSSSSSSRSSSSALNATSGTFSQTPSRGARRNLPLKNTRRH